MRDCSMYKGSEQQPLPTRRLGVFYLGGALIGK